MDADEPLRIQGRFQTRNRLLLEMALSLAVQRDVVVLRFGVIEAIDRNYVDVGAILHYERFEKTAVSGGRRELRGRQLAGSPNRCLTRSNAVSNRSARTVSIDNPPHASQTPAAHSRRRP